MKIRFYFSVLAMVALLAVVLPAAAQEDLCFDKGGVWDPATQRCTIALSVQIDIDYPVELASDPVIAEAVDLFLENERAAFLAPLFDPMVSAFGVGPLTLQIDYEVFRFSDTVLSLQFTVYTYSGGAHGMTYFQTFTFEREKGIELQLSDLFVPEVDPYEVLEPLAQDALFAQLGDMADSDWIKGGTAPIPENYKNWVLTPDALVLTFEPYQVAAYAAGPQTVTVPLAKIQSVLAPEFYPVMAQ